MCDSRNSPKPLTPKQDRFVQEYVTHLNATEAARRAGYSQRSAAEIGHENLRKPQIQAAIDRAQLSLAERTNVTAEYIIGKLLDNVDAAERLGKLSDMNRSLELIGKHIGMFAERREERRVGHFRIEVVRLDDPRKADGSVEAQGQGRWAG